MGRRGPKPGGLVLTVVKLPAAMRAALQRKAEANAKKKKGWNLSDEIRRGLQDSLHEAPDDRTRGVMLLFQSVLRSIVGRKPMPRTVEGLMEDLKAPRRPPSGPHWLDSPAAFDEVVIALNTVLAAIRPPEPSADDLPFRGRFNALTTLQDLQKAPDMAPARASQHVREMVHIRDTIGSDVVDRALTFGRTAQEIRDSEPERLELAALRRKHAASNLKPPGPPLTNEEERRMRALIKRLVISPADEEPKEFIFERARLGEPPE